LIKPGTVFILGAGASHPYKFPLGTKLSELIVEKTKILTNIKELDALEITTSELHKFREDFEESGTFTIDEFLQANSKYLSIGKKLIASVILPFDIGNICMHEIFQMIGIDTYLAKL